MENIREEKEFEYMDVRICKLSLNKSGRRSYYRLPMEREAVVSYFQGRDWQKVNLGLKLNDVSVWYVELDVKKFGPTLFVSFFLE